MLYLSTKVRINQYHLLWINPFRCSPPPFPTEATDERVTVRVLVQPVRPEDSRSGVGFKNINHTTPTFFVSERQVGFSGAPRNVRHAFPAIFLPRSGKAKQTALFPGDVCIHSECLARLWRRQPYIDYRPHGRVMQASCQTDFDHWTPPPVFSREKSVMPRQLPQSPGSFRNERG